jgi:hypothetical protein
MDTNLHLSETAGNQGEMSLAVTSHPLLCISPIRAEALRDSAVGGGGKRNR